ncbi:Osmotin thaumatin-like protein [Lentinula aff. lateritia]|uniref:Osmotin thaumatin-like protein n=1 Tax=Lentinula aff. lateritia TaxID=2804960 RepID=A0ACC1TN60_9AGAR|nr:Osmotin thaumatin-like protein [Lentinula aff. lateritia]
MKLLQVISITSSLAFGLTLGRTFTVFNGCPFTMWPAVHGGCKGGLVCDPVTGTGVSPATLAEFILSTDASIPDNYHGPFDSTGFPVGCKSACVSDALDVANSPNCCSGQFNTAACPPSESDCPDSYAYVFDESSGTALWTCPSTLPADYTVTFCPPPS